jgi:hypothetical protein
MITEHRPPFLRILLLLGSLVILAPASESCAIENQALWDKAFRAANPAGAPCLGDPGEYPGDLYAWHGHYWIRAYLSMAQTYGDTKYLDDAVTLIDRMLYFRDDARQSRGELDLRSSPYLSAPPSYLSRRGRPAPGWRRKWQGDSRVEVVTDGMITQAIMRFVVLVHDDPRFSAYRGKAAEYTSRVEETVSIWNETFAYDRFGVQGSYWFPQTDGTPGLSSTEVPFNQSAVMAATLLLLDRVKGGVAEYRRKAAAVLDFWRRKRREERGGGYTAYNWNYYLRTREYGVEDLAHSHMDLSFFITAYRSGIFSGGEMRLLADTLTRRIHKGGGKVAGRVDGSGSGDGYNIAMDWIDLAQVDPQVLSLATAVFRAHYAVPTWSRPLLGWAEILRWSRFPRGRGSTDDARERGQVGKGKEGPVHQMQAEEG